MISYHIGDNFCASANAVGELVNITLGFFSWFGTPMEMNSLIERVS